ncbi:hypothetical protein ACFQL8_36065 [Streptomyces goshikiensis]|uniref:hypothetical protein n=1 Tax=Streptomyces goshikiensis TaxID=1942 RepID=UPI00167B1874|nr:hypothetical protein [Streptomyces goshikiensis]GHD80100.1 hypothetical protein GCM10010336_63280 [Streptomyces goshikiensis]
MPDTPNGKGPAPVQITPEQTTPVLIPADQVKPQDKGTLSIEYREGRPVIIVSGGEWAPADIPVFTDLGEAQTAYSARPRSTDGTSNFWISVSNPYVGPRYPK